MLVSSSYWARAVRPVMLSLSLGALSSAGTACVGGDAPDDSAGKTGSAGAGASGKPSTGSGGAGGHGGSSSDLKAGSKDSHFPLADNATWSYHHTNPNKEPWDEVTSMQAGTYMGEPAFLFEDQEDAQGEQTTSTLKVTDTGVFRVYKEVAVGGKVAVKTAYDPAFLRYDEAWNTEGQTMTLQDDWTQTCVFTSSAAKCAPGAVKTGTTTHIYTVLSVHSEITVPAGTFDTVLIERNNPQDAEIKRFWFAKGVGKVRELDTTSNATEELTDYHIP